jgi:hypothetical protein
MENRASSNSLGLQILVQVDMLPIDPSVLATRGIFVACQLLSRVRQAIPTTMLVRIDFFVQLEVYRVVFDSM